jgi:hypothetical protein
MGNPAVVPGVGEEERPCENFQNVDSIVNYFK